MDVLMQAETSSRPNLFILIVNPLPLWFVMQFCLSSNFSVLTAFSVCSRLLCAQASGLRSRLAVELLAHQDGLDECWYFLVPLPLLSNPARFADNVWQGTSLAMPKDLWSDWHLSSSIIAPY